MKNSSRSLRPLISFIFPKLFFTTHSNFLDQIETHTRDTLDPISFNNQLTSIAWRNGRSSPAATFNWSSINHVSSIVFYLFIFFFFFFPSPAPPSFLPSLHPPNGDCVIITESTPVTERASLMAGWNSFF